MRLLPNLLTTAGGLALPLSDRTAEQLVSTLLAHDAAGRQEQFREPLEHDAPFALWSLCRAAQAGQREIRTADELAAWLSETAAEQLRLSADQDSILISSDLAEKWADVAAFSLVVARLSARFAQAVQTDRRRVYFLGLLHAVSQQAIAGRGGTLQPGPSGLPSSLLPDWLVNESAAVRASRAQPPSSDADCVSLALAFACPGSAVSPPEANFDFDPLEYLVPLSEERQAWLQFSPWADLLGPLASKLARLENLEQQFHKMLEAEKLESLKELAYGAGHEINNPLANISARAQTLLQEERDPERRRKLSAINTQAFRAHEMIADMMLFARPPQPKLGDFDLGPLVAEWVAELAPTAVAQDTELVCNVLAEPVIVRADKTQIAVAVRALCVNALEALVTGGRVEVSLGATPAGSPVPAETGQTVQITVSDNGPGISSEVRRHIFDPFYSGREAGRGLGFGLSKCWRIANLHGGRIDVESGPGEGARFTITLPASKNR